jgi:type IV pilus assembly protein PilY1
MKNRSVLVGMIIFALMCQSAVIRAYADDTCTFMTTANDIPPNIVILLDNGASMEEVVWHSGYDNSVDYTPNPATKTDIVQNSTGNGFYRPKGYSIKVSGNKYYLVEIPDNLKVADQVYSRIADSGGGSPVWTINGRTIALPGVPSAIVDGAGVKDNATNFRYSKNYLNWLFYSTGVGSYAGTGSDLPNQTRFYFAKKALMTIAKMAANQAQLSIYNFTANASGASNVQPLGMVVNTPLAALPENNTLNSSYVNNINNMGTVTYSPLAEGLASVGGYYSSASSHVAGYYCQKNFTLVVSPGLSSEDQSPAAGSTPSSFSDYDKDNSGIGEGKIKQDGTVSTIPVNQNGSSYLDDVAYYLYNNDIVGYQPGFQNVSTYTVGFMGGQIENLFLINASNNGNGNTNLYDTGGKDYGKYHYVAQNPDELAAKLLDAVNDIISQTNSFTAPVVPVTRTTSGDKIYMAFFKPGKSNFWEGNVTKFGLNANLEIVDKDGNPATYPNGAMREDANPYWQTKDWATPGKGNYILNSARSIYTYLGNSSLTAFDSTNITLAHLAVLTIPTKDLIIKYIRGADVFDENKNGNTTENRAVITGDVLHSEPLIFNYGDYGLSYGTYMFFGSNDGMLHAVKDTDGKEAWAFIPPDILPKLKYMIYGTGHQIYVDSSPKIYFNDINKNRVVDSGEQIILVCGERKGGSSYFALDITNPLLPTYLWRIDNVNNTVPSPNPIIATLGQSWSEPQFGLVKTSASDTVGTPVFFIGAGYSSNNTSGKAILAINTLTGQVLKTFTDSAMNSIASNVLAIDENDNGFIDKVYVGDLGGRMWRLGKFTNSSNVALVFPQADENINNWAAYNIFVAASTSAPSLPSTPPTPPSQFYYPPSLTLENGYDLLFFGTGDRENACSVAICFDCVDRFYSLKDKHGSTTYNESSLVDITTSTSLTDTSLDSASINGWYMKLAAGEKALAENTVYYKTVYFTTFTPTIDPCVPGGDGRVYAMQYKSGGSVLDFNKDGIKDRSVVVGGGIPSKPVMVVTDTLNPAKMLVSVGSANPDDNSSSFNAGVIGINPLSPEVNFLYRWWRELTNF